jgi:signal transduction histidine kinase
MQISEPTPQGYVMAMPPQIQGSPAGDFFNELLRGLIHKQNNFLAVIQGFSSLILMTDGLDSMVKENLDHMKEATQGASGLSERILAASGCVRMNLQAVSLSDYIPLIEGTLRGPSQKFGVPFQMNISPGLPPVLADNGRLKDILAEVILNGVEAVVASGNPGAVGLDILPSGQVPGGRPGCVDIFIRNSGATIAPEKIGDIFKPFKSTKDSKHYGIGLTMAAVLLSQMGGTIGVKVDPDTTTIWISLPAAG